MSAARPLRVGYLIADPGEDLSIREECRIHVERVVRSLREAGNEVSFVAVQSGEVVLTDTGLGLQQFFEARVRARTELFSGELVGFARENRVPASGLTTSDLAFCAGRRLFQRCDLIHARLSPFDVGGLLCARKLGIPLVVEVDAPPLAETRHLSGEPLDPESERTARLLAGRTLGGAQAVVTVSSALGDLLATDWGVAPEAIVVLPKGADAPAATPPDRVAELRTEYGLRAARVLVFIGALRPWQGLEVLLEAVAAVRAKHPDVVLLVVGGGPLREELEERAASLNVADSVRFTGEVAHERVGQLLSLANVAIAPCPPRPFERHFSPARLIELMAAGKAIVAPRLGEVAGILTDEESALLVDPASSGELAHAIGRLLGPGDLGRRLGDGARSRVEREHSWSGYMSRLVKLYDSVLDRAR
jgi:glycosyltransferase involved in cell wall biosynthesis